MIEDELCEHSGSPNLAYRTGIVLLSFPGGPTRVSFTRSDPCRQSQSEMGSRSAGRARRGRWGKKKNAFFFRT